MPLRIVLNRASGSLSGPQSGWGGLNAQWKQKGLLLVGRSADALSAQYPEHKSCSYEIWLRPGGVTMPRASQRLHKDMIWNGNLDEIHPCKLVGLLEQGRMPTTKDRADCGRLGIGSRRFMPWNHGNTSPYGGRANDAEPCVWRRCGHSR